MICTTAFMPKLNKLIISYLQDYKKFARFKNFCRFSRFVLHYESTESAEGRLSYLFEKKFNKSTPLGNLLYEKQ